MWSCKGSMNEHVWIMLTLPPCRGHPSSGRKPPSNQDRHWGNIYCIESKAWRTNHIPEHLVRLRVICRCIRCSQTAMGILLYQKFVHLCKTVLGASLVQVTHVFVHARYVIILKNTYIYIYNTCTHWFQGPVSFWRLPKNWHASLSAFSSCFSMRVSKLSLPGLASDQSTSDFVLLRTQSQKKSVPALAFEHEVSLPATTREITSFNTWIFFLLDKNEYTQRTGVGYVHPGMHALIPRKTSICSSWSFRSPAGSSSVCKLHPMDAQRTSVSSSSTGPLLERAIKN